MTLRSTDGRIYGRGSENALVGRKSGKFGIFWNSMVIESLDYVIKNLDFGRFSWMDGNECVCTGLLPTGDNR